MIELYKYTGISYLLTHVVLLPIVFTRNKNTKTMVNKPHRLCSVVWYNRQVPIVFTKFCSVTKKHPTIYGRQ